jgi:UDP:flavonoid glycosyltransferase YjiC (YdhE family)
MSWPAACDNISRSFFVSGAFKVAQSHWLASHTARKDSAQGREQRVKLESGMRATHSRRVFFFLSAGWGPVVRTLPIANRLADFGVASSFAIGGTIGSEIRAAGFDMIQLSIPPFNAAAKEAQKWWSPYHFLALHNLDIKPLLGHVEAYRKAILEGRPAVVVTDINPIAALAARSLQIAHVTISQSLFLPFRKLNATRWTIPTALPAINKVLTHYGADPVESTEDLDVGDVTLVPSIPEFDPMQNTPPTLHYVGPILGNGLVPLPSVDRSSMTNTVPEVFFYPGRPHDAAGSSGQALLNVGLSALSALDATVTVATGGHDFDIPEYPGRPPEIVPWRVISPAYTPNLIIHHGGHGASLTAISAGIPCAIVPTHAEREYNATNLAALGCGEFVPTDECDVRHVRQAIERVIENPGYADECTRWSQTVAVRKYGGADLAARIIMQMIDAPP